MNYLCPVCSYPDLHEPPEDYSICPCCGTEFENDDAYTSHTELRTLWLIRQAPWFSRFTPAPDGWDPIEQLRKAGLLEDNRQPRPDFVVGVGLGVQSLDVGFGGIVAGLFGLRGNRAVPATAVQKPAMSLWDINNAETTGTAR